MKVMQVMQVMFEDRPKNKLILSIGILSQEFNQNFPTCNCQNCHCMCNFRFWGWGQFCLGKWKQFGFSEVWIQWVCCVKSWVSLTLWLAQKARTLGDPIGNLGESNPNGILAKHPLGVPPHTLRLGIHGLNHPTLQFERDSRTKRQFLPPTKKKWFHWSIIHGTSQMIWPEKVLSWEIEKEWPLQCVLERLNASAKIGKFPPQN